MSVPLKCLCTKNYLCTTFKLRIRLASKACLMYYIIPNVIKLSSDIGLHWTLEIVKIQPTGRLAQTPRILFFLTWTAAFVSFLHVCKTVLSTNDILLSPTSPLKHTQDNKQTFLLSKYTDIVDRSRTMNRQLQLSFTFVGCNTDSSLFMNQQFQFSCSSEHGDDFFKTLAGKIRFVLGAYFLHFARG